MTDWDTIRLSDAYRDETSTEFEYSATRVYRNLQDGEFTVPFSFLNQMMTERLTIEGFISDKEFLKIKGLYPDNPSKTVKVEANIYKFMDN